MTKIFAVSVSFNKDGKMVIVDNKGRVWEARELNGTNFGVVNLPDEPVEPIDTSKPESGQVQPILNGESVKNN